MLATTITTAATPALSDPAPDVKTNVPRDIRVPLIRWFIAATQRIGFVSPIGLRLQMTEMFLEGRPYEPGQKQARIVWEIDVDEGQCTEHRVDRRTSVAEGPGTLHRYVRFLRKSTCGVCWTDD